MALERNTPAPATALTALRFRTVNILDGLERLIVLAFYLQLVARMLWSAYHYANPGALLLLPSEGLVLVLLLIRRRANVVSTRWRDWAAAVCGTVLPTCVIAASQPPAVIPLPAVAFVAISGLFVQLHSKLCLGRSIGAVAANRGIKCSGPYRLVRHPMYAGYLLGQMAFLAMFPSLWNLIILSLGFACQVYRILVEEQLLSLDERYMQYKRRVRYRLVPSLF